MRLALYSGERAVSAAWLSVHTLSTDHARFCRVSHLSLILCRRCRPKTALRSTRAGLSADWVGFTGDLGEGTPGRTRTCGLLLRRQALYPLSYGRVRTHWCECWWHSSWWTDDSPPNSIMIHDRPCAERWTDWAFGDAASVAWIAPSTTTESRPSPESRADNRWRFVA